MMFVGGLVGGDQPRAMAATTAGRVPLRGPGAEKTLMPTMSFVDTTRLRHASADAGSGTGEIGQAEVEGAGDTIIVRQVGVKEFLPLDNDDAGERNWWHGTGEWNHPPSPARQPKGRSKR